MSFPMGQGYVKYLCLVPVRALAHLASSGVPHVDLTEILHSLTIDDDDEFPAGISHAFVD